VKSFSRKNKTKKSTTKTKENTWSHLLKTCLNKMMMAKISLMSKTMRRKKDKNVQYFGLFQDKMFKTCRICTTRWKFIQKKPNFSHTLYSHFRNNSNFLNSTAIATLSTTYYTIITTLHNIIILRILWIVKKKVFFNHFVTVFLPPTKIIVDLNLWRMRNCKQAPHLQQYTQKILLLKNQKSI